MKKTLLIVLCAALILASCSAPADLEAEILGGGEEETTEKMVQPVNIPVMPYFNGEPLNPLFSLSPTNNILTYLIFDPLLEIDENLNISPKLIESYLVEGEKITLRLKANIYFHDGTRLLSSHVKEVLDIVRANPDSPYYYGIEKMSYCRTVSDDTLEIFLTEPDFGFLYALHVPIVKNPRDRAQAIGTGQYMAQFSDSRLIRNEDYFDKKPQFEAINLLSVSDKDVADFSLRTGEIDLLNVSVFDDVSLSYASNFNEYVYLSRAFTYICINETAALPQSIKKYINSAIDRDALDAPRSIPVTNNFYDPASSENTPKQEYELQDQDDDGYIDPEVLERDEPYVLLTLDDGGKMLQNGIILAQQLNSAGILVELLPLSKDMYIQALQEKTGYDFALINLTLDQGFSLLPLVESGGRANFGNCQNLSIDLAALRMKAATSHNEFLRERESFERIFFEEIPIIPLFLEQGTLIISKGISGEINPAAMNVFNGFSSWEPYTNLE